MRKKQLKAENAETGKQEITVSAPENTGRKISDKAADEKQARAWLHSTQSFLKWLTLAQKGQTGIQLSLKKRRSQFHRFRQILQLAVRILNALDKRTIYRH